MAVTIALLATVSAGCYSFRGGSTPAHLETIVVPEVVDNSSLGRPEIRFDVTNDLVDRFRSDNELRVVDNSEADARLDVTLVRIVLDERQGVSSDDRETLRGVTVEARATFYDNVKDRAIYEKRPFIGRATYEVAEGAAGEDEALAEAIDQLNNDILLATVADW